MASFVFDWFLRNTTEINCIIKIRKGTDLTRPLLIFISGVLKVSRQINVTYCMNDLMCLIIKKDSEIQHIHNSGFFFNMSSEQPSDSMMSSLQLGYHQAVSEYYRTASVSTVFVFLCCVGFCSYYVMYAKLKFLVSCWNQNVS